MQKGELSQGTVLSDDAGLPVTVEQLVGSGGQGEVYRVRTPSGPMALKWYYASTATPQQREVVREVVKLRLQDRRFLWPKSFVTSPRGNQFGYVMDLLDPRFASIPQLCRRQVPGVTPRMLYTAAINMVEGFRVVHAFGRAYRDISWNNVLFDPANGDILICDNDNAVSDGQLAGIAGTIRFMAPELVRREGQPRTQTDLHSLAVLLFVVLVNQHPLEGALEAKIHALDDAASRRLYGTHPLFIFDPSDNTNAPVAGIHDVAHVLWQTLPAALRALFVQAFTAGLHEPAARVRETQWRDALSLHRDLIVTCPTCDKQNMFDAETHLRTGVTGVCWKCQRRLRVPPRLDFGRGRQLVLSSETRLLDYHLDDRRDHGSGCEVGAVVRNPQRPDLFGLSNQSDRMWTVRRADGTDLEVPPGRTATLAPGTTFVFGDGIEARLLDEVR